MLSPVDPSDDKLSANTVGPPLPKVQFWCGTTSPFGAAIDCRTVLSGRLHGPFSPLDDLALVSFTTSLPVGLASPQLLDFWRPFDGPELRGPLRCSSSVSRSRLRFEMRRSFGTTHIPFRASEFGLTTVRPSTRHTSDDSWQTSLGFLLSFAMPFDWFGFPRHPNDGKENLRVDGDALPPMSCFFSWPRREVLWELAGTFATE